MPYEPVDLYFHSRADGCSTEQVVVRETEATCGDGELGVGELCDDGNEDQEMPVQTIANRLAAATKSYERTAKWANPDTKNVMMAMKTTAMVVCPNAWKASAETAFFAATVVRGSRTTRLATMVMIWMKTPVRQSVCMPAAATASGAPIEARGIQNLKPRDDGNQEDLDDCLTNVPAPPLRRWDPGPGEGCDDGNGDPTDACTNSCFPARCGDGLLQEGERCDDGNAIDTDDCHRTASPLAVVTGSCNKQERQKRA